MVSSGQERLVFGTAKAGSDARTTWFDLARKTYTKRLTALERDFYRFIYDHKARFVPQ